MINIDLNDTYEIISVTPDLTLFSFNTFLTEGTSLELFIEISKHVDPNLPDVYNLGFGPIGTNGEIDDKITVSHQNPDKVFSTIMLCAIAFLQKNESKFSIGIDGSDDRRAYLYHRMFISNQSNLSDIITTVGVDWYVKLLRNRNDIERDSNNNPLFKPRPEPFDFNRKPIDLYRYYMFSLIN